MIVTLTANPSLDRTVPLDRGLTRGEVHRAGAVTVEPGGKGINVARVVHYAGHPLRAVLPADPGDPILRGLDELMLPYRTVPLLGQVRTNLTLTEPDGTTTKINEPGPTPSPATVEALARLLVLEAERADWVVLSGSLPPGVPASWYADLVQALRPWGCRIAVDTSDAPLLALAAAFPAAAPDLIKPNSEELAQLTGADPEALEAAAAAGDPSATVLAARSLVADGVGAVLVTLGAAGAVLVTAAGAWQAIPPPIVVRSTVGAGDSAVAGYVLAETRGLPPADRLRLAVAYGSAAASLAGTQLPKPEQLHTEQVKVIALPAT
ncbi:1-phosphofructokinase [Propionicimonas sp.]|uniref:1-phosphofructokinase n=1 Tax=Propionicimonas sp. TaxID=1955623 RepID=UPI00182BBD30|nr:1-phosphofructokinase [Propionicimonas sp.]MBU3975439.1 1-phosphofructokinase [Actinomycetota bacterium]MBA3020155.1 1-phosphofructokinase [Propionicimonas sp.]MBU3986412.1 1-phosphofructokinase [Actinomycetota bacterium]MBU4007981.1 1-phosphofructokinase [Actinomycetota bacterium]MBU4064239.1 1-phosphofructokinase [Actinomycetota bacterium]